MNQKTRPAHVRATGIHLQAVGLAHVDGHVLKKTFMAFRFGIQARHLKDHFQPFATGRRKQNQRLRVGLQLEPGFPQVGHVVEVQAKQVRMLFQVLHQAGWCKGAGKRYVVQISFKHLLQVRLQGAQLTGSNLVGRPLDQCDGVGQGNRLRWLIDLNSPFKQVELVLAESL